MRIVIVIDGPKEHALALTSVIRPLSKKYGFPEVSLVTNSENAVFFRWISGVRVFRFNQQLPGGDVDLLVDYGGSDAAMRFVAGMSPKSYLGINPVHETLSSEVDTNAFQGLYTVKEVTQRNIFQMLFGIAGLKWQGEGYNFRYYPRAKQQNGTVGVAVRDDDIRRFVKGRLKLGGGEMIHVPLRHHILKQFDEVNKVESLVTDDPFVLHVGLCLRKQVQYLVYEPPTYKPEFFGNGCIHLVPDGIKGSASRGE
jgi:hypothetical protein